MKNKGLLLIAGGIAIAAAETAVAIAIIINVYRNVKHVLTDDINELKG